MARRSRPRSRPFDWERFFKRYSIEFVTAGANVKQGEINIACPYCGDDPSHHLGVRSDNGWWACWRGRDKGHAGKSPHRLISKLLGVSRETARQIVGDQRPPLDNLEAAAERLQARMKGTSKDALGVLKWPDEIRPLRNKRAHRAAVRYLCNRDYRESEIVPIAKRYGLRFAVTGAYADRVIFPVRDLDKQLMTWTGRATHPQAEIRYMALPNNADTAKRLGVPPAEANIRDCILWEPMLRRRPGRTLYIVEGPFDALRIDWLGSSRGVRSTCLFGLQISMPQIYALTELARKFKRLVVMTDEGKRGAGARVAQALSHVRAETMATPQGAEDPAALPRDLIRSLR